MHQYIRYFLLVCITSLFIGSVFAAVQCAEYRSELGNKKSGWVKSQAAACAAVSGEFSPKQPGISSDNYSLSWDGATSCVGTRNVVFLDGSSFTLLPK